MFPSLSKPLFLHFIDLSTLTVCTCDVQNFHRLSLSSLNSSTPQHSQSVHATYEALNSLSIIFYRSHCPYTRCTKPWQTWMASQSYFIVLAFRTRDVRNHDRLPPVWGSLRLAPISPLPLWMWRSILTFTEAQVVHAMNSCEHNELLELVTYSQCMPLELELECTPVNPW